jgi:predicted nuclease of restriction endonuclease-like (RecB) superfamily
MSKNISGTPRPVGEGSGVRSKSNLYARIRAILESARSNVARSVNTTQVIANWLVGREIVEDEQKGRARAAYGSSLIIDISERLQRDFGSGYSVNNLEHFRHFYLEYPDLLVVQKSHASRGVLPLADVSSISHALRGKSDALPRKLLETGGITDAGAIQHALRDESCKPGILNPNLSWTHYRTLLKVKRNEARSFYEIESAKNGWSARQLERQINSLLFERLLKSRDKKGVLALAQKGLVVNKPIDVIKDPVILEFLDLPESNRLVETDVEAALLSKLKDFLLELGSGFAYIGRQKRLSLEGDHFYPDLVFYHIKLKCYVIIDLKVQKLTHGDLGQMLMYVHYYNREIKTKDENPTIGLILCTDKNDAIVKYVLDDKERRIFTSRYKYELPTEEDLRQELRREMNQLSTSSPGPISTVEKGSKKSIILPPLRVGEGRSKTGVRSKRKKENHH